MGEHCLTRTRPHGNVGDGERSGCSRPTASRPPGNRFTQLHVVGLRDLAEAGNAEAQNELSSVHRYGTGWEVPQDFGVAVALYRQAAERG